MVMPIQMMWSYSPSVVTAWEEVADQYGSDGSSRGGMSLIANGGIIGANVLGRLLEWNGSDQWIELCPPPMSANAPHLLNYDGGDILGGFNNQCILYIKDGGSWVVAAPAPSIGSGTIKLLERDGIAYGVPENVSRLLSWEWGSVAWNEVTTNNGGGAAVALHNNEIYSTSFIGALFKFNDVDEWVQVAAGGFGGFMRCLVSHKGVLYGGSSQGRVYRYDHVGGVWVLVADVYESETSIFSGSSYAGSLYFGTGVSGLLLKCDLDEGELVLAAGQLNSQTHIYTMAQYNGRLFAMTRPDGKLFRAVL